MVWSRLHHSLTRTYVCHGPVYPRLVFTHFFQIFNAISIRIPCRPVFTAHQLASCTFNSWFGAFRRGAKKLLFTLTSEHALAPLTPLVQRCNSWLRDRRGVMLTRRCSCSQLQEDSRFVSTSIDKCCWVQFHNLLIGACPRLSCRRHRQNIAVGMLEYSDAEVLIRRLLANL